MPTRDFLFDNKIVYSSLYWFLSALSFLSKFFLVSLLVGVVYIDFTDGFKSIYANVATYIKIVVAFLVVYRFNSYRKTPIVFTELDRKIANSMGIFIITVSFNDLLVKYSQEIHSWIWGNTAPPTPAWLKKTLPTPTANNIKTK
jgi:hypothetical protein